MAISSSYIIQCPGRENRLSVLNLPKHDRHVRTYIHHRENGSLTQTNNTLGITVWTHYTCMSGLLLTSKGCRSTQSNWKHQFWNCPWFNKFFAYPEAISSGISNSSYLSRLVPYSDDFMSHCISWSFTVIVNLASSAKKKQFTNWHFAVVPDASQSNQGDIFP